MRHPVLSVTLAALAGAAIAADAPPPAPPPPKTVGTAMLGGPNVMYRVRTDGEVGGDAAPAPEPWLGVSVSPAPAVLLAQLRLPPGFGLAVEAVAPDSPAAKAGLAANDLLLTLDDQRLANAEQLHALVVDHGTAKPMALHWLRAGEPHDASATAALHAPATSGLSAWVDAGMPGVHLPEGWGQRLGQRFLQHGSMFLATAEHSIRLEDGVAGGKQHIVVTPTAGGAAVYDGEFDPAHPDPAIPEDVVEMVGAMRHVWTAPVPPPLPLPPPPGAHPEF